MQLFGMCIAALRLSEGGWKLDPWALWQTVLSVALYLVPMVAKVHGEHAEYVVYWRECRAMQEYCMQNEAGWVVLVISRNMRSGLQDADDSVTPAESCMRDAVMLQGDGGCAGRGMVTARYWGAKRWQFSVRRRGCIQLTVAVLFCARNEMRTSVQLPYVCRSAWD
jgi:hypothetical protein